jgi:hypothetical protein
MTKRLLLPLRAWKLFVMYGIYYILSPEGQRVLAAYGFEADAAPTE